GPEGIPSLGLGDDVEVGAPGKLKLGLGEQLEVAGHPATDPPDALRHDRQLAALASQQDEHAVGLAEVDAPEHDRLDAVGAGSWHARLPSGRALPDAETGLQARQQ